MAWVASRVAQASKLSAWLVLLDVLLDAGVSSWAHCACLHGMRLRLDGGHFDGLLLQRLRIGNHAARSRRLRLENKATVVAVAEDGVEVVVVLVFAVAVVLVMATRQWQRMLSRVPLGAHVASARRTAQSSLETRAASAATHCPVRARRRARRRAGSCGSAQRRRSRTWCAWAARAPQAAKKFRAARSREKST